MIGLGDRASRVASIVAISFASTLLCTAGLGQERIETSHDRMIALLAEVAAEDAANNPFLGPLRLEQLRKQLQELGPDGSPNRRLELLWELGMEEFRLGTADRAVGLLGEVYEVLAAVEDESARNLRLRAAYYIGLAHLRSGERRNCIAHHHADSCVFPIRGGGVHRDKEGALAAITFFREVVQGTPPRAHEHVAAKWLLNVAAMAAGIAVDQLGESERLAASVLAPEKDFPRFVDIAPELGIDAFDLAGGAIAEDFNGDGTLDLLTSTWAPSGAMHYYENQDGRFVEKTAEANLTGITGGLNLVQADYDNDGDTDVLVLRGAWLRSAGKHPNSLLRNDGHGVFTDVTLDVGLAEPRAPTQTAAWADYDNDGDLDLFIGNESLPEDRNPCQLFRNDGGRFTDVAAEAGVENLRYTKGVAWGDFDDDRWPDLYVSNFIGRNRLYRNRGDGTFEDVAQALGVVGPVESFPTWFWDFDNDGILDVFVASYPNGSGPMRLFLVAAGYQGLTSSAEQARLYRGTGEGGFEEVGLDRGLTRISMPMGANYGDPDGDGYPDFYLGTGYPAYDGLMPNVLFWNRAGDRFDEVTVASGLGHLQKGHAIVFADFDNDGDQDVFEQLGGFYPEDAYYNALFENPGFGHHWLKVRLVGKQSNRSGIGARIRLVLEEEGETRTITKLVGTGGSFGSNPLTQHIGLGGADVVTRLEIYWPTSGTTQVFEAVAGDQFVEIREDDAELRVLDHPRLPWVRMQAREH